MDHKLIERNRGEEDFELELFYMNCFFLFKGLDNVKKTADDFAPLRRTGQLFGGLRNEILKRY